MMKKKICMLGSFGVGKTSLVTRFVHSQYSDKYHTTVGVKIDRKSVQTDGQEVLMMLWDMAGEEEGAPVKLNQVADAAGYILVVDGRRGKTLTVGLDIQKRVEAEIGPRPFLLLANKVDERASWEIQDSELEELKARGWSVLETSAKTGEGVEEAFLSLATHMVKKKDGDDGEDG